MPKIIQLLLTENNHTWQGKMLGLSSDGVTYELNASGRWEQLIPNIGYGHDFIPPSEPVSKQDY